MFKIEKGNKNMTPLSKVRLVENINHQIYNNLVKKASNLFIALNTRFMLYNYVLQFKFSRNENIIIINK